jgi:hypothetical protein
VIHRDEPSDSNGAQHGPNNTPLSNKHPSVDLEVLTFDDLDPPPRTANGGRIRRLFDAPTPQAIAELSDILWTCDRNPSLSYFGYRLGACLSPQTASLACEVIRRKSFQCTRELLDGLAQREYCHFITGAPPIVGGPEFAEFRKLVADIAVSPDCHFTERDWVRHESEIISLAMYPITILRRSADPTVDRVLLRAVTCGGLDHSMNRRALEILLLRESSDPINRVLPAMEMSEVMRATGSLLRDPFNIAQLYSLLDLWASKEENLPTPGECAVRDQLLARWVEFKDSRNEIRPEENPKVLEALRMLRHFPDPLSAVSLKEAAEHWHPGIRVLAQLALEGPTDRALADLRKSLRSDNHGDRIAAVRVFGYHISPAVDRVLVPILDEYAQGLWGSEVNNEGADAVVQAQRIVLLQGMVRRFYTERADSLFLKPIFDSVDEKNCGLLNLAINTFVQVTQMGRIPPPQFYDAPSAMLSLRSALNVLSRSAGTDQSGGTRALAQAMEELFVFRGPASYGFELVAEAGPTGASKSGSEPIGG